MYFLTRTTLQECKADTLMPATVFTACDLPHNKGFGFSNIFANQNSLPVPPTLRNLSNNERIQDSREQFQFFLVNFQGCTEKSDYHEWCNTHLEKTNHLLLRIRRAYFKYKMSSDQNIGKLWQRINYVVWSRIYRIWKLAELVSQSLFTINQRIKRAVSERLLEVYGCRPASSSFHEQSDNARINIPRGYSRRKHVWLLRLHCSVSLYYALQ